MDTALAWLYANQLSGRYSERMTFHTDLVHRHAFQRLLRQMEDLSPRCYEPGYLASLVSPLVIETDGAVVPSQYGFPREYALGSLQHKTLAQMAEDWLEGPAVRFLELCRQTMERLQQPDDLPFVNWYRKLARYAGETASQAAFPILATS